MSPGAKIAISGTFAAPGRPQRGAQPPCQVKFCCPSTSRRGGRAVECTGLENRRTLTGLVSSNLTLSAKSNDHARTDVLASNTTFNRLKRREHSSASLLDSCKPDFDALIARICERCAGNGSPGLRQV